MIWGRQGGVNLGGVYVAGKHRREARAEPDRLVECSCLLVLRANG